MRVKNWQHRSQKSEIKLQQRLVCRGLVPSLESLLERVIFTLLHWEKGFIFARVYFFVFSLYWLCKCLTPLKWRSKSYDIEFMITVTLHSKMDENKIWVCSVLLGHELGTATTLLPIKGVYTRTITLFHAYKHFFRYHYHVMHVRLYYSEIVSRTQ